MRAPAERLPTLAVGRQHGGEAFLQGGVVVGVRGVVDDGQVLGEDLHDGRQARLDLGDAAGIDTAAPGVLGAPVQAADAV